MWGPVSIYQIGWEKRHGVKVTGEPGTSALVLLAVTERRSEVATDLDSRVLLQPRATNGAGFPLDVWKEPRPEAGQGRSLSVSLPLSHNNNRIVNTS